MMNEREIQRLMHRLFYGDIPAVDGYRHLMKKDALDRTLFAQFLDDYIEDDTVLVYLNAQNCVHCLKGEAYEHTKKFLEGGRVRIADQNFKSKIIIEPLGVAAGHRSNSSLHTDPQAGQ